MKEKPASWTSGWTNGDIFGHLLVGFSLCLFCHVYIAHEQPVYIWDWGGYYSKYIEYGDNAIDKNIFAKGGVLRNIWQSIRTEDYNASSIAPLLPLYILFGLSRAVYVMGIVALYFIPACLVMAKITESAIGDRPQSSAGLGIFTVFAAFLSWPLWIAALRGMPDVVGLIPLGVATLIVLRTNFLSEATWKTGAIVGALIWSTFLLRRWYAFSCVTLIGLTALFCMATILLERRAIWSRLVSSALVFASLGATILVCLAVFQAPIAVRILQTSYGEINAPYQYPFWDEVGLVTANFGPVFIWLVAFGVVAAVARRRPRVLFLAGLGTISFLFFSRTQAPGVQHVMPFYFWLFPVFVFAIVTLADLVRVPVAARAVLAVLLVAMGCGFASVFVVDARQVLAKAAILLPSVTAPPLRIDNYPTYVDMIGELKKQMGDKRRFAVIASSEFLSGSLLESIDRSLSKRLAQSSEEDLRDGLGLAPLRADLVIVSDPPALSEDPKYQRVVTIPVDMILSGKDLGAGYQKVAGPYHLAGGVNASIFKRIRPLSDADVRQLLDVFSKYYPKWKLQSWDYLHAD